MLFPAAVLALLSLAAVAVDTAIAFMGQREAAALAAGAAGDVVVAAVDAQRFYEDDGTLFLDGGELQRAAAALVAGSESAALQVTGTDASCAVVDGTLEVTVAVHGTVTPIFWPAVGDRSRWEVTAASTSLADHSGAFPAAC